MLPPPKRGVTLDVRIAGDHEKRSATVVHGPTDLPRQSASDLHGVGADESGVDEQPGILVAQLWPLA
ncbi:hypothetical protein AC629_07755 [Bradyrhizobium sp. NAS80.1]|nr:hypothetical protein AC630_35665 [Bradyrhizobium sp. AS23.2]OKO88942.1 hypothetical protein AC629_07755 [Bradyrhizobium sp. NAS80.1]